MWFPIGGPLGPWVYLAPLRRYKASKLHLPILKAKSSLRMLRVTWPVGWGQKWPHIWNFQGHIVYSLYNFYRQFIDEIFTQERCWRKILVRFWAQFSTSGDFSGVRY